MNETLNLRSLFSLAAALCITGCSQDGRPPAFEPVRTHVASGDRIARCNTVHSLTVPQEVIRRYELSTSEDLAFISCSLQMATDPPSNIPAKVIGVREDLTGTRASLEFEEILQGDAISYVAPFDLTAKSELRFEVVLVDPLTEAKYELTLRQEDLSGRV